MRPVQIVIIVCVIILLGVVIFPLINRKQFRNLPREQKIRILMKEADSLSYFKNVSNGSSGTLYFVKNRRKILELPWKLVDGKMLCIRDYPFKRWDYPEDAVPISEEEQILLNKSIENFNKKSAVKIVFTAD